MIVANDATVKGGILLPAHREEASARSGDRRENRLPCLYLVDSGGAFLPLQAEVFPDRDHFGRIFFNQARMSAHGIPQIAAVMGSCTAGGAYVPAMSDESVIVRARHDLPRRAAAGEGGDGRGRHRRGARRRRRPHARVGSRRSPAHDDEHAIAIVRDDRARTCTGARLSRRGTSPSRKPRRYDPSELYALDPRRLPHSQYDVREVLARIVDGSRFQEFKALYGETLVCGFARIRAIRSGSSRTTASCSPIAR